MKKALLALLLFATLVHAEKIYQACETTKKEAKASLVNEIVSTIESGFSLQEQVSSGLITTASKETKRTIKSESKLTLSDLRYSEMDDKVCASITQAQLIALAQGKIKSIKNFALDNLPSDEIAIVNFLEDRLADIREAKAITTLLSKAFSSDDIALIESKLTAFESKRAEHFAQKVSFIITPEDCNLSIDGIAQTKMHDIFLKEGKHAYTISRNNYAPMQGEFVLQKLGAKTITIDMAGKRMPHITFTIPQADTTLTIDDMPALANQANVVSAGDHSYIIQAKGYCPVKGTFSANLGSDQTININLSGATYPQLTVNSNQTTALLTIDGIAHPLGHTKTFKTCKDKEVSYQVAFNTQTQTDTLRLEPGMIKTVSMDFLTQLDIKNLQLIAQNYERGSRWVVRSQLEFGSPFMFGYQLDLLNHSKWLRHGWGAAYASGVDNFALNIHYTLAIQFTTFGNQHVPIHLGNFAAVVPYVGIQGGLGYQLLDEPRQFGFVTKALLGADIAFNKFLSLELYYQHNFTWRQEAVLGAALSLDNPFSK